jgi:16S rRNA (cytidine1402-2'-O)-methyltransferase
MQKGTLILIPNTLGDSPVEYNLPQANIEIIRDLKYFIVENIRTARRFLKKAKPTTALCDCWLKPLV